MSRLTDTTPPPTPHLTPQNSNSKQLSELSSTTYLRTENSISTENSDLSDQTSFKSATAISREKRSLSHSGSAVPLTSRATTSFSYGNLSDRPIEGRSKKKTLATRAGKPLTRPQPVVKPQWRFSSGSTILNVVQTGYSLIRDVAGHWFKKLIDNSVQVQSDTSYYQSLVDLSTSYSQWAEASKGLDVLEGKESWKQDPTSPDYDYELLQDRLQALKRARDSEDISQMIFLLRTNLDRNLGDMTNPQLYSQTRVGTKALIEEYNEEVIRQLHMIADMDASEMTANVKYEWFTNLQKAYGRTALLLSGGAMFGLAHFGVIKALWENGLLPRVISGASVGAVFAAAVCVRTDQELPQLLDSRFFMLTIFYEPDENNPIPHLARMAREGALFDVNVLIRCLRYYIGEYTFAEAFNKTRRILNVTVSSGTNFEMPRVLNYLTAPNVVIWSAVAASAAVPFVYKSAPLLAKDKSGKIIPWNPSGHRWIDGSVENDLPMARISELFNVNNFIVAQVNPHVVPFIRDEKVLSDPKHCTFKLVNLVRGEAQHRLSQMIDLGIWPSGLSRILSLLSQRYTGQVTIVPDITAGDYRNLITNPTKERVLSATIRGEKATWPKISMIKNMVSVELAIDQILYKLRIRKLAERASVQANPIPRSLSMKKLNHEPSMHSAGIDRPHPFQIRRRGSGA